MYVGERERERENYSVKTCQGSKPTQYRALQLPRKKKPRTRTSPMFRKKGSLADPGSQSDTKRNFNWYEIKCR